TTSTPAPSCVVSTVPWTLAVPVPSGCSTSPRSVDGNATVQPSSLAEAALRSIGSAVRTPEGNDTYPDASARSVTSARTGAPSSSRTAGTDNVYDPSESDTAIDDAGDPFTSSAPTRAAPMPSSFSRSNTRPSTRTGAKQAGSPPST